MGMKIMGKYRVSDTGVKVFIDYRDNIRIDKDSKVLANKASLPRERYLKGKVKGLVRFGSENSEDAKTWNLFRSLELNKRFDLYYNLLDIKDKATNLLFWGMDSNTGEFDVILKAVLDEIEPPNLWRIQQTEPDVIITGQNTVIFNESKLGKDGAQIDAWNRKDPFENKHEYYKSNAEPYFKSEFIDNFAEEGRRYYQLLRNLIIGQAFAKRLGKQFHLVVLVNSKNRAKSGLTHREEFNNFILLLNDTSYCHLITWDQL